MTIAVALSAVLISFMPFTAASDCNLVPNGLLNPPRREFKGAYRNATYAFSVVIPKGLVAYDAPDPHPHHGFGLILGRSRPRYIMVEGAANALDYSSPAQVAEQLLANGETDRVLVAPAATQAARLGTLEAVRVNARFRCQSSGAEYILIGVVALSPDREMVYQVVLYSWPETVRQDERVLDDLLRSWKQVAK